MKKSLIVIAALILAMSVAGCGKKAENTNTTPQQTAQADASGAYENGSATETLDGQDYSKNVDMAGGVRTTGKTKRGKIRYKSGQLFGRSKQQRYFYRGRKTYQL